MRIINIKINDFRNIVRADVNFGKINIFTGKNASGKSNFLLAVSNSLKTGTDFSDTFYENIVTFGKGKSKTVLKTQINNIFASYIFSTKNGPTVLIDPSSFTFENTFSKKSFSPSHHSLFFSGNYSSAPENIDKIPNDISKRMEFLEKNGRKNIKEELVYGRSYIQEKIANTGDKQVIEKQEITNFPDSEKFLNIFEGFQNEMYSWVDPIIFSSSKIYKYVIERIDNNEVYEQIVNFLKSERNKNATFSKTPFEKAKFIQLLADVQKNEKQRELFKKDLKLYSDGVLTNLSINVEGTFANKGEILVESPNAPRDIFCISAGTAVLAYFILLKNWSELSPLEKSFVQPTVMVFDEIDSIIHPSLMPKFSEVLKSLSKYVQLFISTHSPSFIDCFNKTEVFWLKDTVSIVEKTKLKSISSIYSYQEIIDKISENKEYFEARTNSELFIEGLIDSMFPLI